MGSDFFAWTVANSLGERLEHLYEYQSEGGISNERLSKTDQAVLEIHSLKLICTGPDVTIRCKVGSQALQWLPGEHDLTISRAIKVGPEKWSGVACDAGGISQHGAQPLGRARVA